MCGRFLLIAPGRDLAERFGLTEEPDLKPRYNIAPTQSVATLRTKPESGTRRLEMLTWGLVPFWAKDPSIGSRMINARSETAAQKPSFRAAFKRRRCIIPADGFYEWTGAKGKKQPYLIRTVDERPFALAGLWEHWADANGNVIESCTILTTDANEALRRLHDRMPVILPPEDYQTWLDPALEDPKVIQTMLRQYPSEEFSIVPVSFNVNKAGYDSPDCIEPEPHV
jgi:putative SOS response-associated peptidase YedK